MNLLQNDFSIKITGVEMDLKSIACKYIYLLDKPLWTSRRE